MTSFELAFICAFTTKEFALALPHGLGTKDSIMRIKKIKVMLSRKMDEISLDLKAEILLLLLLLLLLLSLLLLLLLLFRRWCFIKLLGGW